MHANILLCRHWMTSRSVYKRRLFSRLDRTAEFETSGFMFLTVRHSNKSRKLLDGSLCCRRRSSADPPQRLMNCISFVSLVILSMRVRTNDRMGTKMTYHWPSKQLFVLKLSGIANERGILGPHHAYWHPYAILGVWYDDIRSDRGRRPKSRATSDIGDGCAVVPAKEWA